MTVRFIPELAGIEPYRSGPPIDSIKRRFGLRHVVKLASNEYPLPPFPEVRQVLLRALDDLHRYPDGVSADLCGALASAYDRDPQEIAVGSGSAELLYLLGHAVLEYGDEVVLATPTFTAYDDVIAIRGARPVMVPLRDHAHDLEAMAAAVTPRTRLVLVCNPNNPTGTYIHPDDVRHLVEAVPEDVLVVVDEAYIEFVMEGDREGALAIQRDHDNVIVLRTFSKIYGLSGLRTGYGICAPEVKQALDKVRQPFNVNVLGQIAATEALRHQDRVAERRVTTARVRDRLAARLAERARASVPSQANFMLVAIDGLRRPREEVCDALLASGVMVRDGHALGCPGWARVTIGTEEEIDFFLDRFARLEPGAEADAPGQG